MSATAAHGHFNFNHSATARRNPRSRTHQRNEGVEAGSAGSSQVAHTLTACTRCRTVSSLFFRAFISSAFLVVISDLHSDLVFFSVKRNATSGSLAAVPASALTRSASTTTPIEDTTSIATMSSTYSTKSASWNKSWIVWRTKMP
jgi:hypothetical protein